MARQNVVDHYLAKINRISGRSDTIPQRKLIRHFNEQLLLPLPLAQDLSPDQYARLIEQLPVNSPIQIHTGTAPLLPYGAAAAHLLGYVQSTHPTPAKSPTMASRPSPLETKLGKTGLERSFNEFLSGTTGMEIWRVDPLGFQDTRLKMTPPQQGKHLITSIDMDLQLAAETALGERTGAAIALDIQSGEVLTLVSHPTYDLNDLSPFIPTKSF